MFELQNETIAYEQFEVLKDINLHIKKGEKVALLGKSGSGKSTLLKFLFQQSKEKMTYIPQELGLVDNLSVFHNVYMARLDDYSSIYNVRNLIFPCAQQKESIAKILRSLELEDKIFIRSKELSGGQKQRCAIARALYTTNDVLLADEPISALDEYLSNAVLSVMTQSFDTIVCALHNVPLATTHFDRVIGLKQGQILVNKTCDQLSDEDRQKLYYACE